MPGLKLKISPGWKPLKFHGSIEKRLEHNKVINDLLGMKMLS